MNITLNNEMKMFYYALLNRSAMYLQQCYCLKCSTNFQTKHSNLKNRFFFPIYTKYLSWGGPKPGQYPAVIILEGSC